MLGVKIPKLILCFLGTFLSQIQPSLPICSLVPPLPRPPLEVGILGKKAREKWEFCGVG